MKAKEFEKYAGKNTKGKKGDDNLSGGKIRVELPSQIYDCHKFC